MKIINKRQQEIKNVLPLLSEYNKLHKLTKWCTPASNNRVIRARSVYKNDMSLSYRSIGNPNTNSGAFGRAAVLASRAYKSDATLFSVNGTTSSNFVVLKALKLQNKHIRILAQRNVHKSIIDACRDYQIDISFLPATYSRTTGYFLPNQNKEIIAAIKKHKPHVLLLTNPTYEGYCCDIKKLITSIRATNSRIIIFIDEAWGAHLCFSDSLPDSAMEAGADICVQSTHKMGMSLQQTGMIHIRRNRVDLGVLREAYTSLTTTSPSFHLLSSLDSARYFWETQGKREIGRLLRMASAFSGDIQRISKEISVILPDKTVFLCDGLKVNVSTGTLDASYIASVLEKKYGIIVEKYTINTLLFIMNPSNNIKTVKKTVATLKKIVKSEKVPVLENINLLIPPSQATAVVSHFNIHNHKHKLIAIKDAVGRICTEDIIPYPPGIPLLIAGEIVSKEHVDYLLALNAIDRPIKVLMQDTTQRKIRVLQQ